MDLLKTQSTPIQILREPQKPFPLPEDEFCHCTLQYYYDNGNYVFITGCDAIYKYNLDQQIITKSYEFPALRFNEVYDPVSHFDPRTGIFYVVHGNTNWMTFNTNTNQWNKSFFKHQEMLPMHSFKYIPPPIHQLHVIIDDTHYLILDAIAHKDNKNYFAKKLASNIGIGTIPFGDGSRCKYKRSKHVYYPGDNELMMFVESTNDILTCNIYDKYQELYKWEKSKISLKYKLPPLLERTNFEVILGFDQILFVFNLERWCIECIDLKHQENGSYIQWIDNESLLKQELIFEYVVKDNKNSLHFLKLNEALSTVDDVYNKGKTCHFKVSLIDLIPLDILKNNQRDWEILIVGYCKKCEKNDKLFIPNNIKQLILQFYPIFV